MVKPHRRGSTNYIVRRVKLRRNGSTYSTRYNYVLSIQLNLIPEVTQSRVTFGTGCLFKHKNNFLNMMSFFQTIKLHAMYYNL